LPPSRLSAWISYTLKMEAIRSSETSVNKISIWRHIPEDGILHGHRRENLKSHICQVHRSLLELTVLTILDDSIVTEFLVTVYNLQKL
jgi:hypothetical protein